MNRRLGRPRTFSALVAPAGVHLVQYRWSRGDLRVMGYTRDLSPCASPEEAARVLGSLLGAAGGRGGKISIAMSGFGIHHQILSLPPAPPSVLRPVIAREMRRLFPDLFSPQEVDPILEYAPLDASGPEQPGRARDLLAAAAPPELVDTFCGEVRSRGARLVHWTIVPRAVQRLYQAYVSEDRSIAMLLMVERTPLLGLFHAGELRLFSEPVSVTPTVGAEVASAVELLQRGSLFLRQQYRGASLEGVLLAADAATAAELRVEIERWQPIETKAFGSFALTPGALAALGAALDGESDDALSLLSPDARPLSRSQRWTRRLVVASLAVLMVAGGWWAGGALVAAERAEARLSAAERTAVSTRSAFQRMEPLIRQRQAHAHRSALLELLARGHHQLPEALWPLQAASPMVSIQQMRIQREESGWSVAMTATARGRSSADATDVVDGLVNQLRSQLPDGTVSLTQLSWARAGSSSDEVAGYGEGAIAVTFELSFIVPIAHTPSR